MKSTSRGTALFALAVVAAASGCTESEFLNTGTYQVTLVTDVDDSGPYECVLVDILELHLRALQPEAPGDAIIRAIPPSLGGSGAGGFNPGVRNVNFTDVSCPIGQCTASAGPCGDDSACTTAIGLCRDTPAVTCQRDNECPDAGFGRLCLSACPTSPRICDDDTDCDAGDTCALPDQGMCLITGAACTDNADCPTGGDVCEFLTCRGTSVPCQTSVDCPLDINGSFRQCVSVPEPQKFCQSSVRPCSAIVDDANDPVCDPGETCPLIDNCIRFNSRNAPVTFHLSAGTYEIVSLVPSSYSLRDLDDPLNSRECPLTDPIAPPAPTELVGFANDDPEDLIFTVGPGEPNQIVLTVMDVVALADPNQTPDGTCYINERERFFDLRDPADGP
jgi:hypothetical protein